MLNLNNFFPGSRNKYFTCGTLKYTLGGMVILFIWLLWGDFIFNIFDIALLQQVMPLKLKALGASDTLNAVVNKSLAAFIAFFMTPFISFRSDRHRGKTGRRIPFLRWSTPFVGLFMVLMGFSDSFAALLSGTSPVFQIAGLTNADVLANASSNCSGLRGQHCRRLNAEKAQYLFLQRAICNHVAMTAICSLL